MLHTALLLVAGLATVTPTPATGKELAAGDRATTRKGYAACRDREALRQVIDAGRRMDYNTFHRLVDERGTRSCVLVKGGVTVRIVDVQERVAKAIPAGATRPVYIALDALTPAAR